MTFLYVCFTLLCLHCNIFKLICQKCSKLLFKCRFGQSKFWLLIKYKQTKAEDGTQGLRMPWLYATLKDNLLGDVKQTGVWLMWLFMNGHGATLLLGSRVYQTISVGFEHVKLILNCLTTHSTPPQLRVRKKTKLMKNPANSISSLCGYAK